eukprot:SAG25_NODE_5850_length_614_cov_1.192233_1_plen_80_part_01
MAVKDAERARRMAGHSERAYYNLALTLIKAGDSRIQPDFTWSPPPKNVYGLNSIIRIRSMQPGARDRLTRATHRAQHPVL